jgi:hypothetical protein
VTFRDTEPSDTTPGNAVDLRRTSDVRLIMIALARVEERMKVLVEADTDHKADFRWTWGGLVLGFLILAGFFIAGYNRLEDKYEATTEAVTKAITKIDDIQQKLNAPQQTPPARR